jgi:hypothetical protein
MSAKNLSEPIVAEEAALDEVFFFFLRAEG